MSGNVYVPLHCHSDFSTLDGLQSVGEYLEHCEECGFKAAALTDHGTCQGLEQFEWYAISHKLHVKPIFGIETYLTDDVNNIMTDRIARTKSGNIKYDKNGEPLREKQKPSDFNHGCLWAQNQIGLENLFKLSTLAYKDGFYYKPRIDLKMLSQYHDGLFVSDGCMLSQVSRAIVADKPEKAYEWYGKLIDIFGKENVLVELHTWQFCKPKDDNQRTLNANMRKTNLGKIAIARDLGLRMIAVNDAHYAKQSDWKMHDLAWATTTGKGKDFNSDKFEGRGATADWVMTDDEVRYWLGKHDVPDDVIEEAIQNTSWVADRCNAKLDRNMKPPRFMATREEDEELFDKTVMDGFAELVPKKEYKKYLERLNAEVELIHKMDLTGYFNIVSDYANFVRAEDPDGEKYGVVGKHASLLGPGRGCFLPGNLVSTFKRGKPKVGSSFEFDEPLRRIEDIKVGQRVLTHDGTFQKVLDKFEYDVEDEDCIELKLSNGHVISCTADHCLYREDEGFVMASQLKVGDVLEGAYRPKEHIDWQCSGCGKPCFIFGRAISYYMTTDSAIRKAGDYYCRDCATKIANRHREIAGALANKKESAREKNRKTQIALFETTDRREKISSSIHKRYSDPENRAYVSRRTSEAISNLPEDKLYRMTTSAKHYKNGWFKSQKNGKQIYFASSFELKAINILETDSHVVSYDRALDENGNSLFIEYSDGHRYNPDFQAIYDDGTKKIIEVKAKWERNSDRVQQKALAGKKYCEDNGFKYEIWTEDEMEAMNDRCHKHVTVESVRRFKYTGKVYDLHVENVHNYTVGRVTVHNSASGSIICYLMHITNVDPIVFDLFFERFLTAGRVASAIHLKFNGKWMDFKTDDIIKTEHGDKDAWQCVDEHWKTEFGKIEDSSFDFADCPDIDLDFEAAVIPQLNEYLGKKYGYYGFAQIGTQLQSKLTLAFKDIAKVKGMSDDDIKTILARMREIGIDLDTQRQQLDYEEDFKSKIDADPELKELNDEIGVLDDAWNWAGHYRAVGIHASGYVISRESMFGKMPLRLKDGKLVTEFEHDGVARLGFIKFDVLKLSALGTIRLCYEQVNGTLDVQDIYRMMRDEKLLSNKDMWKQTWNGDTLGIFQMDSALGNKTAMNARITSLRDAAMISAADRPGLVRSGLINDFYKVRLGLEPTKHYHPMLDDILDETNGFLLYQEQIMKIYQKICHMSLGETDYVRKVFTKKRVKEVEKMKVRLHDACMSSDEFLNGIPSDYDSPEDCFNDLWRALSRTAEYCFNKGHATSYGMVTCIEEYFKYNYPAEFICAYMNVDQDVAGLTYAKVHGINVSTPNVNKSKSQYVYDKDSNTLFMPLWAIKGVGGAAVKEIIDNQPYESFDDYLEKTSGRGGKKKDVLTSLISLGAFDGVDERDRFQIMVDWKKSRGEEPPKRNTWKNPRIRGKIEETLLGVSLSYDPVFDNREWLESQGPQDLANLNETPVGDWIVVAGQITQIRRHQQRNGKTMAWLTIRLVSHEEVQVTMFGNQYERFKELISTNDVVAVGCKRTDDWNGKISLVGMSIINHSLEQSE